MVISFLKFITADKVLKSFQKDIFSEREPRKRQVFLRSKKEVYGPSLNLIRLLKIRALSQIKSILVHI